MIAREAAARGQDVVMLYPGVVYGPGDITEGNLVAADSSRITSSASFPRIVGPRQPALVVLLRRRRRGRPRLSPSRRPGAGERYFLCGENATLNQLFALVQG